jgi:hypothetical protein
MKYGQISGEKYLENGSSKIIVLLTIVGLVLLGLITGVSLAAAQSEKPQDAVGYYTKDGETFPIVPGGEVSVVKTGNLTPSQMEAMFSMSPEEEAKIVHAIPSCPVIIDGVEYKAGDINLFDGIRLRFIVGKEGNLYAFTTAKGLEEFQAGYKQEIELDSGASIFYMDMWYVGESFGIYPGNGYPYLYQLGYDNAVSSVKATSSASWTYLYDYTNFQGDVFTMAGGTNYSMLYFQGWNDRASSASVSSY